MRFPFKKRHTIKHVVLHKSDLEQSLEGFWDGTVKAGHYELTQPKLLLDNGQERALEGYLMIPAKSVVFVQVLGVNAAV